MTYRYDFDDKSAGDLHLRREDYKILQEGLTLLRGELEDWNRRVLEHGTPNPPFEQEVADLNGMIGYGDEQLRKNTVEVFVGGVSVGTLRYVKAALMFLIRKREQESSEKSREGWPSAALKSLTDRTDYFKEFARVRPRH